jgi:hypothetical protein
LQKRRLKTTHTQGVVAKVKWEPIVGNPYTGLYETGYD